MNKEQQDILHLIDDALSGLVTSDEEARKAFLLQRITIAQRLDQEKRTGPDLPKDEEHAFANLLWATADEYTNRPDMTEDTSSMTGP